MDWTFTFADTTIAPLPQGEPRIDVNIAGDEIASVASLRPRAGGMGARAARVVHAQPRHADLDSVVFGGLLVAAAISGMIAWSRGRYAPRLFLIAAGDRPARVRSSDSANSWPRSSQPPHRGAAPVPGMPSGLIAVGPESGSVLAAIIGLAIGALPRRLRRIGDTPIGTRAAARYRRGRVRRRHGADASKLRTPAWAQFPGHQSAATIVPRSTSRSIP